GDGLRALGKDRQFVRRRAPASPTGGVLSGIWNLGCHFTPSLRNSVFRSARASRGPRFKARQAQNQQPARSTKSAANQPQNPEPRQDLLWFPKIAGSAKSQTWRRNMPFALFGGRGACGSNRLLLYGQTRLVLSPPLAAATVCTATGRAASVLPAAPPSRIRAATRRASISACKPEICAWKMAIWFSFSFIASYIFVIVLGLTREYSNN